MEANSAAEPIHQGIVLLSLARLMRELYEPFAESVIEGPLLGSSEVAGPFDEVSVGTEGDVLHTQTVYTILVYTATLLSG
jgi:hypothetical protein